MRGQTSSGATVRAMAVFHRVALDLSRDAEMVLGQSLTADLDMRVMQLVHRDLGISSSALVEQLELPRSTVARALARVRDAGLVERERNQQDARRAQWRLTPLGQQKLDQYIAAAAETFLRHRASFEHLLLARGRALDHASGPTATTVLGAIESLRSAGTAMDRDVAQNRATIGLVAAVDRAGLLSVAEHGSSRPGQLADDCGLSPAGVTSLVDRLVGEDLVVRERGSDNDGRAVVITLTSAGRRSVESLVDVCRPHEPGLVDALTAMLAPGATIATSGSRSRPRDERALLH